MQAFAAEASAAGADVKYEAYDRKPAVAFYGEEEQAIPEVIFVIDQLIERANKRREQMAAAERQRHGEQQVRDQHAEKIQNEIDQKG